MFKAYEAVRDRWGYLDCYISIGPIQFKGPGSDEINFMVKPPSISQLMEDTDSIEAIENANQKNTKDTHQLNTLSKHRTQDVAKIPKMFDSQTMVSATKKMFPSNDQIARKLIEYMPALETEPSAQYFVEIHDELLTNYRYLNEFDDDVNEINREIYTTDKDRHLKIGLVFMGKQAPGGQNVVDGLLRFQAQRGNVELIGFLEGVAGLFAQNHITVTREAYANFHNLGGYDYLGRGADSLREKEELE